MSDFFDEELEEKDNSSLLLADIDWTPQNDPFDISVDSFALNIVNRLSGIDEDKFKEEVENLAKQQILDKDIEFFYTCYCNTYMLHNSSPYLTKEFFYQLNNIININFN